MARTQSARARRSCVSSAMAKQTRSPDRSARNFPTEPHPTRRASGTAFLLRATLCQAFLLASLAVVMALMPGPMEQVHAVQAAGCLCLSLAASAAILVKQPAPTSMSSFGDHDSAASAHGNDTPPDWLTRSDVANLTRLKARMSHELRTPLNAVIGFSEMMQQEVLGPVGHDMYREYAANIRASAERFRHATEKTLAVTELLTQPARGHVERSDLTILIKQSLAQFADDLADVSIELSAITAESEIEIDRAGLLDALDHVWHFAIAADQFSRSRSNSPATCLLEARPVSAARIDVELHIAAAEIGIWLHDTELLPNAELSLLLARLGVEASGGSMSAVTTTDTLQLRISLLRAAQHEFAI